MKTNSKETNSLAVTDSEYFNDEQNKIELVNCKGGNEAKCKKHLLIINKNFHDSDSYLRDKLFQLSIEELRNAYYKTFELTDKQCLNCSNLFRSVITDSLNDIKVELKSLRTGFFGNKHFELGNKRVEEVLQELEKARLQNQAQLEQTKERYMESFPKKSVS